MTYDRRQSISRSLFVLQTVALAVGLASIDKAFEEVDQHYFGQAANEARKTVEQANDAVSEKVTASSPAVDNTTLAVRVNAALNAAPGLEASIVGVATRDGLVTLAGTADNATKRDLAKQPRIER